MILYSKFGIKSKLKERNKINKELIHKKCNYLYGLNVISKVEFNLFFCHDECNFISYDIRPVELLLGSFQRILFLPKSLIESHYPLKFFFLNRVCFYLYVSKKVGH